MVGFAIIFSKRGKLANASPRPIIIAMCVGRFHWLNTRFNRESGLEIENIKQNQKAWPSRVKTGDVACCSTNMTPRCTIESQSARTTCRECYLTPLVATRPVIEGTSLCQNVC